jgi:hypothetical protein
VVGQKRKEAEAMKPQQQQSRHHGELFVFTSTEVAIVQDALRLYEQCLQRRTHDAKTVFAREMLESVQGKFQRMQTTVAMLPPTLFDYNEKIVLATAIQLYMIDLLATPATPGREGVLNECERICDFALGHPEMKPIRDTLMKKQD